MASNQRQGRKSAGLQRLALLVFAALLIVLFLIFAIAQGLGNPSVPSGAVAIVEDAPDEDLGTVTEEEFERALEQAAASAQIQPVPKPGDKQYEEVQKTALGEIFDAIWIQGQAEEMGFTVTEDEISKELVKLKNQAFKTEKQYREFLKEANFTEEDVNQRVTIQILSGKIQEAVTETGKVPSDGEIEAFYDEAKSSQFTTPESRDVRIVKNKDKAKVEAAKAQLEKDDSTQSWGKVTKKFSTDAATKESGGLQTGVTEGQIPEPLGGAIFAASQGEVEGPIQEAQGYAVFEVMKVTPEDVQSLEVAKSQISTQLAEQARQQEFTRFVNGYGSRWKSRTFCADDFTIERCANFTASGRSPEANPACYEADPKGGPPEACPAPVPQVKPAQPGSVNPLTPEGQKLAQRPRPSLLEPALPEGAPPPGAPPVVPSE